MQFRKVMNWKLLYSNTGESVANLKLCSRWQVQSLLLVLLVLLHGLKQKNQIMAAQLTAKKKQRPLFAWMGPYHHQNCRRSAIQQMELVPCNLHTCFGCKWMVLRLSVAALFGD